MPVQIYRKIHLQKLKNFRQKTDIFHISAQNIYRWYLFEPPRRCISNNNPQSMFLSRNKKSYVYLCKPQFYYIKVGFEGVSIIYRIRSNYGTYPYKRTVKKFRSFQMAVSIPFVYFFIKAYVVGTHLNCIDLSMQFKWVPTTYAFIKKIRKNGIVIIK